MNRCFLAAAVALCAAVSVAQTTIGNLRVCHLVEPSDVVKPVFSWQMRTERQGAAQKAYAIDLRTASGEEVWRSGRIDEAASHAAPYTGPALKSATRHVWSVVVTDEGGRDVLSEPATFTTGLITSDDWNGSEWIAVPNAAVDVSEEVRNRRRAMPGASCFAKRLGNAKRVKEAWWTVTGQGVFQAYVNGNPLPGFLKPGFDHVLKTRHSFTFDVTGLVNREQGEDNVFSSIVTAGWWRDKVTDYRGRESAFRAQLILRYEDGTEARFGTDESWRGGVTGPVKAAGIFDGEEYDAREKTPWMTTGETDAFAPVKTCHEFKGEIVPMEGPAVALREDLRLKPRALYVWKGVTGESGEAYGKVNVLRRYVAANDVELKAGETLVVDFGQNAAAVPEFRFAAREGTRLVAKAGEMLCDGGGRMDRGNDGPEGSVYRGNLRVLRDWGAKVEYVFSGDGDEFYRPEFTYLGYRYLSVTATDDVRFQAIASVPVTSVPKCNEVGRIETGVADVNRLISNVLWGQYSNYLSVPTDCPQRDERLGWTADAQVFCAAASRNADVYGFLCKWMRDMRDSQHDGGSFAGVAPPGLFGDDAERFGWSDAGVIVPYTMWKRYGDIAIVEENFAAVERYMALTAINKFDSPAANEYQWGDWVSFEALESHDGGAFEKGPDGKKRPRADALVYWHFLGGCYWLMDAQMCAEMAEALGKAEAAARYRAMADDALAYVRGRFLEADGMLPRCLRGMQTPALFALKCGVLVRPDAIAATKETLLKNIREHGDCLQTGFLGTPLILDVLTYEVGRPDVAYTLLLQRKNPSWLHSVEQGATTIWERWNGYSKAEGFLRLSMKSYNHYAYGAVLEWMYGTMAGIQPDPKCPGWRHFVLAPKPDRRMGHVNARYDSPYGRIESVWEYKNDGGWKWRVTVPPNTTATVEIPTGRKIEVAAGEHVFKEEKRSPEGPLSPGGWNPVVRERLNALIEKNRGNPDAYAVFDFDYTTAIGDLSYVCMWELLENFDIKVDDFHALIAEGMDQKYKDDIDEIGRLAAKLKPLAGQKLADNPVWREFVSRYWAFYRRYFVDVGDYAAYLWRSRLFAGYTPSELRELARRGLSKVIGRGRMWRDVNVPKEKRGMVFAPEIKELFRELRKAGIAVYIVSGSFQEQLFAATGPEFGLDIDPACVFGAELKKDASGRYLPEMAEGCVKSGEKPSFIRAHIAPRHHGAEPILTAGDSVGDYTMLTEYKDLQLALVFVRNWKQQEMRDLAASGGRVVVQGRDESRGCYIPELRCVEP